MWLLKLTAAATVVEMALRKTRSHYCQTRNFFRLLLLLSARCPDLSRAILRNYCLGPPQTLTPHKKEKKSLSFFPRKPGDIGCLFHVTSFSF